MKNNPIAFFQKGSRIIFLLLAMSVSLSACVEMELNRIAGLPEPLEETETRMVMRDLAASISTIEDAGISDRTTEEQKTVITAELNEIATLIDELESRHLLDGADPFANSHEVIGKYLGTLSLEVELAREEVNEKNSDLFIAGKLAGVCRGCHEELWPES